MWHGGWGNVSVFFCTQDTIRQYTTTPHTSTVHRGAFFFYITTYSRTVKERRKNKEKITFKTNFTFHFISFFIGYFTFY